MSMPGSILRRIPFRNVSVIDQFNPANRGTYAAPISRRNSIRKNSEKSNEE